MVIRAWQFFVVCVTHTIGLKAYFLGADPVPSSMLLGDDRTALELHNKLSCCFFYMLENQSMDFWFLLFFFFLEKVEIKVIFTKIKV